MIEVTAHLKNYRQAPRKVRLLADLIRGASVEDALMRLNMATKRAAHPITKLLLSALANAEHNHKINKNDLTVARITVDRGQILKRMRPRARGTGNPIHKHTSHISIVLAEKIAKPEKLQATS